MTVDMILVLVGVRSAAFFKKAAPNIDRDRCHGLAWVPPSVGRATQISTVTVVMVLVLV